MLFPGGCCRQGRLPSPCLGSRMLSRPVGTGMLRKEHLCGRARLKHKFSGFFYFYFSLFQFLHWKRGHQFILLDVTSARGSAGRGLSVNRRVHRPPLGGQCHPGHGNGCVQRDRDSLGAPWLGPDKREGVGKEMGEDQGAAFVFLVSLQIISRKASLLRRFTFFKINELVTFCGSEVKHFDCLGFALLQLSGRELSRQKSQHSLR